MEANVSKMQEAGFAAELEKEFNDRADGYATSANNAAEVHRERLLARASDLRELANAVASAARRARAEEPERFAEEIARVLRRHGVAKPPPPDLIDTWLTEFRSYGVFPRPLFDFKSAPPSSRIAWAEHPQRMARVAAEGEAIDAAIAERYPRLTSLLAHLSPPVTAAEIDDAASAEIRFEHASKYIPGIKNANGPIDEPRAAADVWRMGFRAAHVIAARSAKQSVALLESDLGKAQAGFRRFRSQVAAAAGMGMDERSEATIVTVVENLRAAVVNSALPFVSFSFDGALTEAREDTPTGAKVRGRMRAALLDYNAAHPVSLAPERDAFRDAIAAAIGVDAGAPDDEVVELVAFARENNKQLGEARNKADAFAARLREILGLPASGATYARIIERVREFVGWSDDSLGRQSLTALMHLRDGIAAAIEAPPGAGDADLIQRVKGHAKATRKRIGDALRMTPTSDDYHVDLLVGVAEGVAESRDSALRFRAKVIEILGFGSHASDADALGLLLEVAKASRGGEQLRGERDANARDAADMRALAAQRLDWLLRVVRAAGLSRDFSEDAESVERVEQELRRRVNACAEVAANKELIERLRDERDDARNTVVFNRQVHEERERRTAEHYLGLEVKLDREIERLTADLRAAQTVAACKINESATHEANTERLEGVWRGMAVEQEAVLEKLAAAGLGAGRHAADRQRAILAGVDVLIANMKAAETRASELATRIDRLYEEINEKQARLDVLGEQLSDAWDAVETLRPQRDDLANAHGEFFAAVGERGDGIAKAVRGLVAMIRGADEARVAAVRLAVQNEHALGLDQVGKIIEGIADRLARNGAAVEIKGDARVDQAVGALHDGVDALGARANRTMPERPAARADDLRAVHAKLVEQGATLPEGPMLGSVLFAIDALGAAARVGREAAERLRLQLVDWRGRAAEMLGINPDGAIPSDKEMMAELRRVQHSATREAAEANELIERVRGDLVTSLGWAEGPFKFGDIARGVSGQRAALDDARRQLESIAAAHEAGITKWRASDPGKLMALSAPLTELVAWLLSKLEAWETAGAPYTITTPARLTAAAEMGRDTETILRGRVDELEEALRVAPRTDRHNPPVPVPLPPALTAGQAAQVASLVAFAVTPWPGYVAAAKRPESFVPHPWVVEAVIVASSWQSLGDFDAILRRARRGCGADLGKAEFARRASVPVETNAAANDEPEPSEGG